uniref:NADH dehydrogenase subunit 6 n=1 Tax=Haementeria sp. COZEM-ANN-HIR-001/002 TaxID=3157987 RepID=A0AAT9J3I0_9ANNE
MTLTMINIILTLSITMMTLKSPMMMAVNILLLALSIAWTTSFFISTWYAYLIFLIYIGGMLIMFAYFVALTPNQQLKVKNYFTSFILTFTIITIPSLLLTNKMCIPSMNTFQTKELYNMASIPMLYMMILLLLFIMLMVTKLIYTSKGPLRPFM